MSTGADGSHATEQTRADAARTAVLIWAGLFSIFAMSFSAASRSVLVMPVTGARCREGGKDTIRMSFQH